MTREEAITLIKSALKTMYLPKSKEYVSDLGYALEIAIKALEQEPCGDAISRQAVVGYLCTHCPDDAECFKDCDDIKNIKALPPVTPQPKMGKWIKSRDSYGNNHFTCPFCEHDIATKGDTWEDNYCSNCGARMDEVEDGNK